MNSTATVTVHAALRDEAIRQAVAEFTAYFGHERYLWTDHARPAVELVDGSTVLWKVTFEAEAYPEGDQ